MSPAERPGGDRRNLTAEEFVNAVKVLDVARRQPKGGNNPEGINQYTGVEVKTSFEVLTSTRAPYSSSKETAELLGASVSDVERGDGGDGGGGAAVRSGC